MQADICRHMIRVAARLTTPQIAGTLADMLTGQHLGATELESSHDTSSTSSPAVLPAPAPDNRWLPDMPVIQAADCWEGAISAKSVQGASLGGAEHLPREQVEEACVRLVKQLHATRGTAHGEKPVHSRNADTHSHH
jgi:hypothetical protein